MPGKSRVMDAGRFMAKIEGGRLWPRISRDALS